MKRVIISVLLACSASAADYYIHGTGSNGNDGLSWGSSWATLAHAATRVAPGDTVHVGAGFYSGRTQFTVSGTEGARITWKGYTNATLYSIRSYAAHNTFDGFTIGGNPNKTTATVQIWRGAHGTWLFNNFVSNIYQLDDGTLVPGQAAFALLLGDNPDPPRVLPFDSREPSNCIVSNNVVSGISGESGGAFRIGGSNNIIVNNLVTNQVRGNTISIHGLTNIVRGNVFKDYRSVPTGLGGHADVVQMTGITGKGSAGHIFEGNLVLGNNHPEFWAEYPDLVNTAVAGWQTGIGDGVITWQDTIHTGEEMQSKNTLNKSVWYEWVKGDYEISLRVGVETFTESAKFRATDNYAYVVGVAGQPHTFELIRGIHTDQDLALEYYGGWIMRNNVWAWTRTLSWATPNSIIENNVFYQISTQPDGPHAISLSAALYPYGRYAKGNANNVIIRNNVFIDCGKGASSAWYSIGTDGLTNYVADHNYVIWRGAPVPSGEPARLTRWWEPNGINGLDARFVNPSALNFRLRAGSPLIDAGFANGLTSDFHGWARPMGSGIDIGPFEHDPNLRMWLDFDQGFEGTGIIEDVSGHGNHAFNPMGTNWADWPGVVSPFPDAPIGQTNWITAAPGIVGSAGRWVRVGSMTNDQTNVYPLSQYAAVTNLAHIEFLTNATMSVWVQLGTVAGGAFRHMAIMDTGNTVQYSTPPELFENSWGWKYGPLATALASTPYGPLLFRYSDHGHYPTNLAQWTVPRDGATWHHLAATWQAGGVAIGYHNGIPFETNDFPYPYLRVAGREPGNPPHGTTDTTPWLALGSHTHGGSFLWGDDSYPNSGFYIGLMDEVMIWDRALAAAEIEFLAGIAASVDVPDLPPGPPPAFRRVAHGGNAYATRLTSAIVTPTP